MFDVGYERLRTEEPSHDLQRTVVDALIAALTDLKDSLGPWEKSNFTYAISALAWNPNNKHQPSEHWTTLSLLAVEHAFTPPTQRDESHTTRLPEPNNVGYDELMDDLQRLRMKLG